MRTKEGWKLIWKVFAPTSFCPNSNTIACTWDMVWCNFLLFSCSAFLIFLIHLGTLAFSARHSMTADFTASNCDQIRAFLSGSKNNVSCTVINFWQASHPPFCFASQCSSNSKQPLHNYTIWHFGLSKAKSVNKKTKQKEVGGLCIFILCTKITHIKYIKLHYFMHKIVTGTL